VVGAMGASHMIEGLLFGVTSTDPLTYAGIVALLLAIALLACLMPARSAAAIDPIVCLRND
jgi:ABC-type lipoprotein release transport system permease subunit